MAKTYLSEFLPEEYHKRQHLLLYYNDLIVDMLKTADEYNLISTKITFENENDVPNGDEDQIDWLIKHGYKKQAYDLTKRLIFFSLLRDFILYMHESFSCSERGKVTVAFAISRKPLKDDLFYLCWILVDSNELVDYIMNKDTCLYDISKISEDKKRDIINRSCQLIDKNKYENILFDLIYKRNSNFGLSSVWDQSLHLVTGNKNYKTESGNLNFVFADNDIWNEYWQLYYDKIPYIMNIAIDIITLIYEDILKPSQLFVNLNKAIRDLKFILTYKEDEDDIDFSIYEKLFRTLEVNCDHCSKQYHLDGTVLKEFMYDYVYTCPHCNSEELVGKYIYCQI